VVSSFRNSFFNTSDWDIHRKGIASARAGNVIGGGDWSKDRILPDIARALLKKEVIRVRNPRSVRPWQHVLEPLSGYLLLGGLLKDQPSVYAKAFNFGPLPEDHLRVEELVRKAIAVWEEGSFEIANIANQSHEAKLLKLDIQSAVRELNWKPKLDASTAIQWTIEWYKTDPVKQAEYTFRQINNYFAQ
jgi:CDP-glucose 4,6-dehydratase